MKASGSKTSIHILMIENNPDDALLTELALRKHHIPHDLVVLTDGEEAMDYLHGNGKFLGRNLDMRPHVVLLDFHLPKMSGLEVLRQIRANEQTRHTPVVIVSASNFARDITLSSRLGANGYIYKPELFSEILAIFEKLGLFPPLSSATKDYISP